MVMTETLSGVLQGLLSGMLWGLDTSLNALVLTLNPLTLDDPRLISSALLLAFFHDFFSAIFLAGDIVLRQKEKLFIAILRNKSTYFVALSALFAGPIGMQAYLYAVNSIGSGLTATISAIYPALAALLGAIFFKDYLTKRGGFGLSLVILAVIVLGAGQLDISNNLFWGMIAAFLCAGSWAAESIIIAYGIKEKLQPKQALLIRQWTCCLAYLGLMSFEGNISYSLSIIFETQIIFLILAVAMIGTMSYLCYYSAIDKVGPVKATGMNVTYSIWTAIFSLFIFGGNLDIKLVICGMLIIIGTLFVIKN